MDPSPRIARRSTRQQRLVLEAVSTTRTHPTAEWVYEAGLCDERDRDKDWVNYMYLLQSGEETIEELDRIHGVIERFTASMTKQELLDGSLARRLLLSPAFTVADVLASPQLASRDFWVWPSAEATGPRYPGPFARLSPCIR